MVCNGGPEYLRLSVPKAPVTEIVTEALRRLVIRRKTPAQQAGGARRTQKNPCPAGRITGML